MAKKIKEPEFNWPESDITPNPLLEPENIEMFKEILADCKKKKMKFLLCGDFVNLAVQQNPNLSGWLSIPRVRDAIYKLRDLKYCTIEYESQMPNLWL